MVVLGLDTRGMTAGAAKAQGSMASLSTSAAKGLGAVPIGAAAAGLAMGLFAAKSVSAALKFEEAFTKIDAVTTASSADIETWRNQVGDLATETGRSSVELADAMFFIASAGLRGSRAMDALEASAKAAAVGLGETKTIADAITSAMNSYAQSGLTAGFATDVMIAAVREGKMPAEDLAGALGQVLPVASQLGVSFDQVAAAIASSTRQGLNAARAATGLRFLLSSLIKPSDTAVATLGRFGFSLEEVQKSLAGEGLLATLTELAQRFDLSTTAGKQAFATVVGGARGMATASILVGQNAEAVSEVFDNVANAAGALGEAFKTTAESEAFKLSKALNDIKEKGQDLATNILPPLASSLGFVADNVDTLFIAVAALIALKLPGWLMGLLAALGGAEVVAAGGAAILGAKVIEATGAIDKFDSGLNNTALDSLKQFSGMLLEQAQELTGWGLTADEASDSLGGVADSSRLTAAVLADGTHIMLNFATMTDAAGRSIVTLADGTFAYAGIAETADSAAHRLVGGLDDVAGGADRAGRAFHRFGGLTKSAVEDLAGSLQDELPSIIGTVAKYKDTFSLSPNELEKITATWVKIGKTIAHDLGVLGESDLKPKMKAAIAALPPEMRNAWVEGNARQRTAIETSIRSAYKLEPVIDGLVKEMFTGGKDVGESLMTGGVEGIVLKSPLLADAASEAVREAIAAARRAAGATSPSKVMAELGVDLMLGLAEGLEDTRGVQHILNRLADLTSAIGDAVGEGFSKAFLRQAKELEAAGDDLITRLERKGDRLQRVFDRLQERADSFGDSVRSAFDIDLAGGLASLEELTTATAAEFLSNQLDQAQAFADSLTQLQAQGLSASGLQQLIGQGPEQGLEVAQLLLASPELLAQFNATNAALDELGQTTATTFVDGIFGPSLEKAAAHIERFTENAAEKMDAFADRVRAFVDSFDAANLPKKFDALAEALDSMLRALDGGGGGGGANGASMAGRSRSLAPGATMRNEAEKHRETINVDVYIDGEKLSAKVENGLRIIKRRNGHLAFENP